MPVWTSQLFVSDWWQSAPVPLSVKIQPEGEGWSVKVENRTEQRLTNSQIVIENYLMPLGELPPRETRTFKVSKGQPTATSIRDFVGRYSQPFQDASQSRQRAFGSSESGHISDLPNSTVAASFIGQMNRRENYAFSYLAAPGLELSSVATRECNSVRLGG